MGFSTLLKDYQTLVVGIPSLTLIILAYIQIKHMKSTRDSELFLKTFEMWNSDSSLNRESV